MAVKVSVVVPVYNPGPAIEPCIASLLGQSLPADRIEILFVDDGSTDGSAARLDGVAAEAPNVRVVHIPPSGAPGRPRNVGLAEARGEYVHFVDADDVLAPRALEWLTAFADRNGSDVVMGKYASASLDRSQVVFTHSRARASLASTPELLTASWAPAKLFRTAMLREHGITFPEGWRWLEDQVFLLRAYLAARNVSIFADAPCYFFVRREEGGHLSAEVLSPEPHVEHLGEAFDVIEAATPPGPLRGKLLRRFYRANILSRLDHRYLAADAALRDRTFAAFHGFATGRVDPSIDATFGGVNLVRARLVRSGDAAALLRFVERIEAHEAHAVLTHLAWRDGRLVVTASARLRHRETGEPMPYLVHDGRTWLDPELTGGGELVDAEIASTMGRVSLLDPRTALEWLVPGPFAPVVQELGSHPSGGRRAQVSVVASVEIDPGHVGPAGIPLSDGAWSVILRWGGTGIGRAVPLRGEDDRGSGPAEVLPAAFGNPLRLAVPRVGPDGLSLEVTAAGLPAADWRAGATSVVRQGGALEVELPIVAGRGAVAGPTEGAAADAAGRPAADLARPTEGATAGAVELVLRSAAGERTAPAALRPALGRMRVRSTAGAFGPVDGVIRDAALLARLGPPFRLEVEIGRASLDGSTGLRVAGAADRGTADRARRWLGWRARSIVSRARGTLRQAAVDAAVRLPDPLRRVAVGAYRRVRGRGA